MTTPKARFTHLMKLNGFKKSGKNYSRENVTVRMRGAVAAHILIGDSIVYTSYITTEADFENLLDAMTTALAAATTRQPSA